MFFKVLICILMASQSVFAQPETRAQQIQKGVIESPGFEDDAQEPPSKTKKNKKSKDQSSTENGEETVPGTGEIINAPAPTTPPPSSDNESLINQAAEYLQGPQEGISDRVIILANQVDKLFGNTRALDEYYGSSLRIYQTSYLNTRGSGSYDIQTNLNLSLPNWRSTEKTFQRWWGGDTNVEDERVTKKEFKELNPWDFTQGVNLRFSRPLAYSVVGRASKNFLTGGIVNHFYQQFSWDSDRLWEEVTSLTSDYAVDRKNLLRFINEADWSISNRTFNSYHGPSFIYTINKISLTSFDLRLITAVEDNLFYTDNYTAGITYRTALHPLDWMFLQITPQLSWPRIDHFTSVWTIYLSLEIVFGSVK